MVRLEQRLQTEQYRMCEVNMHPVVLLLSRPLHLQGIKRFRREDRVLLLYSPNLPPSLTLSCTLPVTESAALEEQVAAGDRANLT